MNLHEILSRILEIANYPKNKREQFIEEFYEYYFFRLINEVGAIDHSVAQQLTTASTFLKDYPEKFKEIWQNISQDVKYSPIIEKITNEVLGELADDVAKWASDAQKQQILAILPN